MSSNSLSPQVEGSQRTRRNMFNSPKERKEALRTALTRAQELRKLLL